MHIQQMQMIKDSMRKHSIWASIRWHAWKVEASIAWSTYMRSLIVPCDPHAVCTAMTVNKGL
jgi:hypothetical protein